MVGYGIKMLHTFFFIYAADFYKRIMILAQYQ